MRLVVDTNIIISALIRDSLTRKALLYPYFIDSRQGISALGSFYNPWQTSFNPDHLQIT